MLESATAASSRAGANARRRAVVANGSPAQPVPSVDSRARRRAVPQAGQAQRQRRRPEPAPAKKQQAARRQHDAGRGQVNHDAIERVSRLRQPISRRRNAAERGRITVGNSASTSSSKSTTCHTAGITIRGQDQPGPSYCAASSDPVAKQPVHPPCARRNSHCCCSDSGGPVLPGSR